MSNRTLRPVAMRIVRLLLVVIASVDAVAAPKRSLLHSLRNFATSAHHPRTELIREEEVSLVQYARKARFKGIDEDKDTHVSLHAPETEMGRVFNRLDLDGNSKLSQPEFPAVMMDAGKQRKVAEAEFALFDQNGDGTISYDEFARNAVRLARRRSMRRRLLAEAGGVGVIAWFSCVVVVARPSIGAVACSSMMGAAVAAAIYATRKFSGAHLNPAFTAASVASGSFRLRDAPAYMLAQLAGAIIASAAHAGFMLATATQIVLATPMRTHLAAEVGVSFLLFLLFFLVGDEVRRGRLAANLGPTVVAGIVAGFMLSTETAGLHVCLNPAVGLGGMLVSAAWGVPSSFAGVGVSVFGPLIGSMLAVPIFFKLEQARDALFREQPGGLRRRLLRRAAT